MGSLFNGYKNSVWDNEKMLEVGKGTGHMTLWVDLMPLKYVSNSGKNANFT